MFFLMMDIGPSIYYSIICIKRWKIELKTILHESKSIRCLFIIIIVGGQNLSSCVGLKPPFTNNNASKEEKALGNAP